MYVIGASVGQPVPDLLWQVYLERQRERAIEALDATQPAFKLCEPGYDVEATGEPQLKVIGRDSDLDGLPDACDSDDDNDGFPDSLDPAPLNAGSPGAEPALGRQIDIYV